MAMAVTAAIWLLFVAFTVWPPFRRGPLGDVIFLMTMAMNEIPLALLAVFGVAIAVTDPPVGSVLTAVTGVLVAGTTLGLLCLQVRAGTAQVALSTALDHELGPAWRTTPGRLVRTSTQRASTQWRGVLLPFQRHRRGIERLRDLSYGPDSAHRLDLYRGPSTGGHRPVLIHLHGGHFTQGGKSREGVTLLNQLADHGWLCCSANYRLGRAGEHPNPLIDTKRVIAWIRAHAQEYGADPSQIFIVGSSAGGHLAISAGLTADLAEFQPGFEDDDCSVAGVVVLYGYLGARSADATSSPARLARPDAPPMLIIHGAHDTMVPPRGTSKVAATLRSRSHRPVVFAELPYAQHSFDLFASVRARSVAAAVEAFLTWVQVSGGSQPRR